ncbi:T9SS type A sorting domain-containing protein [Winogradskyella jejuensis]|nr:T9SS type A sorting domain-containing protein [Winogradskyella jejuensis]
MKRNYLRTIFAFTLFFVYNYSFSQNSLSDDNQTIQINKPICEIPAVEDVSDFSIQRRESVIEKMEGRSSNPCSSFIVSYNGFPPDLFGGPGEAQIAFQFAVDIWASLVDSPVPIRVNANFAPAAATNLGSASPAFYEELPGGPTNPFAQILYPAALYEKLIGEDSDGALGQSVDITCNFNSNRNDWYFGLDANPPSNRFDFVTVVLHELGHGLGIAGFGVELNNGEIAIRRDQSGFSVSASSNHVSIWDTYVDGFEFNFGDPLNPDTPPILDEARYPDPTTPSNTQLRDQLTGENLSINAPIALSQNGGDQPRTYAPTTFNGGSSYSHLDEATFNGTPHALMTPFSAFGEANHDPGNIILGFMEDMGWTLCQGSLSTNNFSIEAVKISPNPFTESLTITLPPQLTTQEFNFSIVDINGRVVLSEIINRNNEITISNLSSLDEALYFLNIESKSSDLRITKKIIKQ